MQSSSDQKFQSTPDINSKSGLQLLLFVDKRANSKEQSRLVQRYLNTQRDSHAFDLEIIDIEEQPYLAERFRLIVTPALVKIYPDPRRILAGNNLVAQLDESWTQWLSEDAQETSINSSGRSLADEVQFMKLTDEVFRLQRENEELRDQLRFKDRIIAMLAHDLRNPLTAVSIALETLEGLWTKELDTEQPADPSMLMRLSQHARSQMKIIERMITNLLEASQGGQSQLELYPRKLDLDTLCQSVLTDLQSQMAEKQQILNTDIPLDLPWVHADSDSVRQVFVNLLDNAIKYTPPHGHISVSILHRTTQKVQVSISDDGLGIPEEKQKFVFDDKFRLARDKDEKGYGLGLALCRRIVQAHYGQIWVDSTPEKGSCFHFTLPIYRP
jgi:two-component system, OmpR family, clock-associated histidine kinase SasA